MASEGPADIVMFFMFSDADCVAHLGEGVVTLPVGTIGFLGVPFWLQCSFNLSQNCYGRLCPYPLALQADPLEGLILRNACSNSFIFLPFSSSSGSPERLIFKGCLQQFLYFPTLQLFKRIPRKPNF